jgi:hypothetical protein
LVQRDVRDIQGRLVHPKNYHDVLRPGSLLLINATLHCFIMPPNDRNKRERKVSSKGLEFYPLLTRLQVLSNQRPLRSRRRRF